MERDGEIGARDVRALATDVHIGALLYRAGEHRLRAALLDVRGSDLDDAIREICLRDADRGDRPGIEPAVSRVEEHDASFEAETAFACEAFAKFGFGARPDAAAQPL